MFRFLSTIALTTLLSFSAQAQLSKWYLGLGTGLVAAKIQNPDKSLDWNSKVGLEYALRVEYYPTKYLGLATSFGATQMGTSRQFAITNASGDTVNTDGKIRLQYLKVPVLLKLRAGTKFRVIATGGLYSAFLQSATEKIDGSKSTADSKYAKTDLGFVGAFGVAYQFLEFLSLEFELSSSSGFININKDTNVPDKLKNSASQFKLSLLVSL